MYIRTRYGPKQGIMNQTGILNTTIDQDGAKNGPAGGARGWQLTT